VPYPACVEPLSSRVGEASGLPLRRTRFAALTACCLGGASGPPLDSTWWFREHPSVSHRSRLSILLLDLPPERHAGGSAFWAGATGRAAAPDPDDGDWASLGSFADGWHVEIQRTGEGTPPRWHVDIETDDIPAEVARLEALGATRHRDMGSFWQLLDPAGLVFCVVGIQTGDEFERHAVTWP
jgi:hypothetical protein